MKNILITGAVGEIGLLLTKAFIEEGYDVYGIDHVNREDHEELAFLGRNALFHFDNRSVSDVDWNEYAKDLDVIFHLAHSAPPMERYSDLRQSLRKSFKNMKHILAFASECSARVVLVSTIEVYGDQLADMNSVYLSPEPKSLYGSLMYTEESFLEKAADEYGVNYHILRTSNISGCSHPIENRCHLIDESEKAGISTQSRELINGQTLPKEKLIKVCMEIVNGGREEQIIPLFNK